MRRYKKLLLVMIVVASLGIAGLVLTKIQQRAAEPFPGAIVVLDDASWQSRWVDANGEAWFRWATPDTILYQQDGQDGKHLVQRKVLPDGTASPPKVLPMIIKGWQEFENFSPDGTTLCLREYGNTTKYKHVFVRTDGQGKPITLWAQTQQFFWTPDSRFVYGTPPDNLPPVLERGDPHSGTVSAIPLNTKLKWQLSGITPDGRMLGNDSISYTLGTTHVSAVMISELRGTQVVTTTQLKPPAPHALLFDFAPDGKRLLWEITDEQILLMDKLKAWVTQTAAEPRPITRWIVTEADGKKPRQIGGMPFGREPVSELVPEWTPDGKGVHFVQEGKLMYLDVP
jgi:hypothetical protein